MPFDHPLFVLYSSGTTGLPKPIVHGHGGILLEHLKIHALHHDLGAADRFFWYSTTGWMMWNYLVSGLAVDATIVLYDGAPAHPDLAALWRLAAEEGVTYFGTSAPFLMACRKEGLRPMELTDLSRIRGIGSTGAPLPAEGFRYVYDAISASAHLQSVSGGTDVCTAFVGASPLVPVWEGEISCRHLGCAVEAFSPDGRPLVGEQGELVITRPMPSMPVAFWNDPDGDRYRAAYFEDFPGVWRHGDWITFTERGSCVISGRSDATLNRGGVRIGTAEFYAVVEAIPAVADALVVHLDDNDDRLLLFVALREGRRAGRRPPLDDRAPAAHRVVATPRAGRDSRRAGHPAHPVGQEARGAGEADPHRNARRGGGLARVPGRSHIPRCVHRHGRAIGRGAALANPRCIREEEPMALDDLQTWELWYPGAAATGLPIARARIDPVDVAWAHAVPRTGWPSPFDTATIAWSRAASRSSGPARTCR